MSVAILGKPKDRLRSDLWVQKAPARPEDGDKPSVSAVWVNELAVDGYPSLEGVENLHDMFERSVKAHPDRRCLGHRPSTQQGEAGPYEWLTYKEVCPIAFFLSFFLFSLSSPFLCFVFVRLAFGPARLLLFPFFLSRLDLFLRV
eukprot:jgi/Botrbrau1/516/Bobra.110_2s0145.1